MLIKILDILNKLFIIEVTVLYFTKSKTYKISLFKLSSPLLEYNYYIE